MTEKGLKKSREMPNVEHSPIRKGEMRSGKVREVASDPNISRPSGSANTELIGSKSTCTGEKIVSTDEIMDEREVNYDTGESGASNVSFDDALAAVMNRMGNFEKMISEYEKRMAATDRCREAIGIRNPEGGLGAEIVDGLLERLAALEVRLQSQDHGGPKGDQPPCGNPIERADEHGERVGTMWSVDDEILGDSVDGRIKGRQNYGDERGRDRRDGNSASQAKRNRECEKGEGLSGIKLPRGGWLKNPFEEISFVGRKDGQNLMRFVNRFERIADYEGVEECDKLHYFGRALRDNAAIWFELNEPETYSEAKRLFLEQFWGEEEQSRFRQRIYTGKYRPDRGMSMADYAQEYARQAKLLDPPMSEHEIIRAVKGHFSIDIAREIRATTVSNLKDMMKLLSSIEAESGQTRKGSIDNRRSEVDARRMIGRGNGMSPKRGYQRQRYDEFEERPRFATRYGNDASARVFGRYPNRGWRQESGRAGTDQRPECEQGYRGSQQTSEDKTRNDDTRFTRPEMWMNQYLRQGARPREDKERPSEKK